MKSILPTGYNPIISVNVPTRTSKNPLLANTILIDGSVYLTWSAKSARQDFSALTNLNFLALYQSPFSVGKKSRLRISASYSARKFRFSEFPNVAILMILLSAL
jgi:hypothetical protein